MKIHFGTMRPNRYGGFNVGTLCRRAHSQSEDGINSTQNKSKVTCKFCKKLLRIMK